MRLFICRPILLIGFISLTFPEISNAETVVDEISREEFENQVRDALKSENAATINAVLGTDQLIILDYSTLKRKELLMSPVEFARLAATCDEEAPARINYPAEIELGWVCRSETADKTGCFFPSYNMAVNRIGGRTLTAVSAYVRLKPNVKYETCEGWEPPPLPYVDSADTQKAK